MIETVVCAWCGKDFNIDIEQAKVDFKREHGYMPESLSPVCMDCYNKIMDTTLEEINSCSIEN